MSGAVDLSALKEKAEAQRAQARQPAAAAQQPSAGSAPTGGNVIDVTDATFETEVLARSTRQLVLVDLWAEWCGPCKQLSPVLEKLANASGGSWVLAKIDVDANPATARDFQVVSIPTMILFKDGAPVKRIVGAKGKAALLRELADVV